MIQIINLLLKSNFMMMIMYMVDFVFFELNERVSVLEQDKRSIMNIFEALLVLAFYTL
jgi:hypothetical protein